MEANDIVKRLLEDPSTRREIMRAIAEARGVEVNLDDPPGWLEDALENVYKIIIELVKELGETIIKASTEAFKPLAEGIITEMFKVLEAPAPVTFDEAVDRASRWLSISASMNVAIVAISVISQLIPGVSITAFTRLIDWWYWGLGMGFMGWQIVAPLTRAAILTPLDRYYRTRYRTRILPPGTAISRYSWGALTKEELTRMLQEAGLDDESLKANIAYADRLLARRIGASPEFPPVVQSAWSMSRWAVRLRRDLVRAGATEEYLKSFDERIVKVHDLFLDLVDIYLDRVVREFIEEGEEAQSNYETDYRRVMRAPIEAPLEVKPELLAPAPEVMARALEAIAPKVPELAPTPYGVPMMIKRLPELIEIEKRRPPERPPPRPPVLPLPGIVLPRAKFSTGDKVVKKAKPEPAKFSTGDRVIMKKELRYWRWLRRRSV